MAHCDESSASTAPALAVRSRNSGGRRTGVVATSQHHSFASVSCLSAPSCPRLAGSDLGKEWTPRRARSCIPPTSSASRRVSSPSHPGTTANRVLCTTSSRTSRLGSNAQETCSAVLPPPHSRLSDSQLERVRRTKGLALTLRRVSG
jgi:hypothetical protein